MGIDLERFKTPEQTSMDLKKQEDMPEPTPEQQEFPF